MCEKRIEDHIKNLLTEAMRCNDIAHLKEIANALQELAAGEAVAKVLNRAAKLAENWTRVN